MRRADRTILFLSLWCSTGVFAAPGEVLLEIQGSIYPVDQMPPQCGDLLKGAKCPAAPFGSFHVVQVKEKDGSSSVSTFKGPEGVQVTEQSWEKDGHVRRALIENQALKKRSELLVQNGKAYYSVTDLETGQVKTSESEAEDNLVVPSTVMSYVRPHFQALRAGQEVRLKVAVLDRRESYSFVMRKVAEGTTASGDEMMKLEMAPVSFIVKALVDPMYFYVLPKSGRMYAFEGRSALRRRNGDSWKEMKVRTAYEYTVDRAVVGGQASSCLPGALLPLKEGKCAIRAQ